jgi:hypothetical protein
VEGVSPHYAPSYIPANFMIRFFSFTSLDKLCLVVQKIGESEIAYELMGFNAAMAAANIATSNEEDIRLFNEFKKYVQGPCCMVIIAGNSTADFNYKKKVLQIIAEETGGKSLEKLVEDNKVAGGCLWRWIRSTGSIRETFRATGVFGGEVGGTDLFRLMADYIHITGQAKGGLIKRGLVYDDDISPFTQSFEHGHYGHGELLIRYAQNPATFKALTEEFLVQANQTAIVQHFGVPAHVFGDATHDLYGPHVLNYNLLLRKIKKTFDPNKASESSYYITEK